MALLRILLLALVFLLNHSVAAAKSVHTCCLDADCPVSVCADMGCLPACAPPLAAAAARPALPPLAGNDDAALAPSHHFSDPIDSIWRPPQ
ncbi:hypothetical protein [Duganella sp. Root198D2]|uniref:hypothetical protein n=1 Tax=Duganella sp. Root198D2 TaxID=1736489 RepID=UPI000709C99C|nr:hypothetical protein [Duganella sp. Root198D2]KRC02537.1 hypothetical protein ASE26_18680 [Duganella sp. Root198D2]